MENEGMKNNKITVSFSFRAFKVEQKGEISDLTWKIGSIDKQTASKQQQHWNNQNSRLIFENQTVK